MMLCPFQGLDSSQSNQTGPTERRGSRVVSCFLLLACFFLLHALLGETPCYPEKPKDSYNNDRWLPHFAKQLEGSPSTGELNIKWKTLYH